MNLELSELKKKLKAHSLIFANAETDRERLSHHFHGKKSLLGIIIMMLTKLRNECAQDARLLKQVDEILRFSHELLDDLYKIYIDLNPQITKRGGLQNIFTDKVKRGSLWPQLEVESELLPIQEAGFTDFEQNQILKLCLDWLRYFEARGYTKAQYIPEIGNGSLSIKLTAIGREQVKEVTRSEVEQLKDLIESRILLCGVDVLEETNWLDVAHFRVFVKNHSEV